MSYEAATRSNKLIALPEELVHAEGSHGIWFIVRIIPMSFIGGGIGEPCMDWRRFGTTSSSEREFLGSQFVGFVGVDLE